MIYPAHLEEEVKKYCEIAQIPLINGLVPKEYTEKVSDFVHLKMRSDRYKTREKEELDKYSVSLMFKNFIGKVSQSPIEEYMYNALVGAGLDTHCRKQFKIGTKIADIAFPIAKLVVECDGKEFHHANKEQIENDLNRDKYLARKGWTVLHFEGLAIRRNIGICIEKIKSELEPFLKLQGV